MKNFVELLKELRLFIALFVSITGMSIFNIDVVLDYVYMYNAHLVLLIIFGIYTNHFLSSRRHKHSECRLDLYQKQLNEVILENSIGQLKAEVRQAFKDYDKIETIDFITTIKYIQGLNKRRIDLGINSYTEDMMTILLNKIKL